MTDQPRPLDLDAIRARFEQTTHPEWRAETDMGRVLTEIDRLTAELQQARQQTTDARSAWKRLKNGLIASAHLLDKPSSNAPEQSPWTRLKPAMQDLEAATDPAAMSGD